MNNTPVTQPNNAFAALFAAESNIQSFVSEAAYDAINDRIIVGWYGLKNFYSFTPTGTLVATFTMDGNLVALAYDVINHRVAAVDADPRGGGELG